MIGSYLLFFCVSCSIGEKIVHYNFSFDKMKNQTSEQVLDELLEKQFLFCFVFVFCLRGCLYFRNMVYAFIFWHNYCGDVKLTLI